MEFFPFTSAQWKELERQTIIYKYMSSSIPVPPHLLILLNNNNNNNNTTNFVANSKDLEAGRCRRSDGKKWRCSKAAAPPNHKYCERHMHRARPRSRKLVEDDDNINKNKTKTKTKKKTRLTNTPDAASASAVTSQMLETAPSRTNAYTNRDIGWITDNKMLGIDGAKQQWSPLMGTKTAIASEGAIYGYNTPLFQQNYGGEPLNLFSYTASAAPGDVHHRNYESQFFLNYLDNQSRGFIDAWSNDNFKTTTTTNDASVASSLGDHSLCSLTLSMAMAADNSLDEEMLKIQDGYGYGYVKEPKDLSLTSSFPWVPFSRGGPLAEVLHSGGGGGGGGESVSAPASTVSSPSGVLHRALFSQSDTSVCNSPILPPPELQNEVGFQWLY